MDRNQKGANRPFLLPNWRKFATQLGRKFFPVGAHIRIFSHFLVYDVSFCQDSAVHSIMFDSASDLLRTGTLLDNRKGIPYPKPYMWWQFG